MARVIAVLPFVCLFGVCLSQRQLPQQQPSSVKPSTPAQASQEPSQNPSSPGLSPNSRETGEKGSDSADKVEDAARSNRIIALATCVIALFTLVSIIVAVVSNRQMRRYLALTQQVADATTKSANLTDDALRITERAYIQVEMKPSDFLEPFGQQFDIVITNTGHTPAMIERIETCSWYGDLPATPDYGNVEMVGAPGPIMAGESKRHKSGFASTLGPDRDVTIYGRVIYVDRFDQRHTTGYARIFSRADWGSSRNPLSMPLTPGYNYAD